jgi:hypothetical protein
MRSAEFFAHGTDTVTVVPTTLLLAHRAYTDVAMVAAKFVFTCHRSILSLICPRVRSCWRRSSIGGRTQRLKPSYGATQVDAGVSDFATGQPKFEIGVGEAMGRQVQDAAWARALGLVVSESLLSDFPSAAVEAAITSSQSAAPSVVETPI